MTKINPLNHLQKVLNNDIAWRKKEITTLKFQCNKKPPDLTIHRSAILLLYAHWEGFIKNAAISYLEYLNSLNIQCQDMHDHFFVLQILSPFMNQLDIKSTGHQKKFFESIPTKSNHQFSVPANKIINTKSNLTSDIFLLILKQLGIPQDDFELKSNLIDTKLLKFRNAIAHGERQDEKKTIELVMEITDEIINLLDTFQAKILDSAENQRFLKLA